MTCLLCELERKTEWFCEDEHWIICDCLTCGIPMAVLKEHSMAVSEEVLFSMLRELARQADKRFGEGKWYFRFKQRQIFDHLHIHAEKIPDVYS